MHITINLVGTLTTRDRRMKVYIDLEMTMIMQEESK